MKKKSLLAAYLLSFPLGLFGAHKYYLRNYLMGVAYSASPVLAITLIGIGSSVPKKLDALILLGGLMLIVTPVLVIIDLVTMRKQVEKANTRVGEFQRPTKTEIKGLFSTNPQIHRAMKDPAPVVSRILNMDPQPVDAADPLFAKAALALKQYCAQNSRLANVSPETIQILNIQRERFVFLEYSFALVQRTLTHHEKHPGKEYEHHHGPGDAWGFLPLLRTYCEYATIGGAQIYSIERDDTGEQFKSLRTNPEHLNASSEKRDVVVLSSVETSFCPPMIPCSNCKGKGICPRCAGRKAEECPSCRGTGHCVHCQGRGDIICARCRGTGRCAKCTGDGYVKCTWCDGTGKRGTADSRERCTQCQGTGRLNCNDCGGRRACSHCDGMGRLKCTHCGGVGSCSVCGGHKYIVCGECRGQGICRECDGARVVRCPVCNGAGCYQDFDVASNVVHNWGQRTVIARSVLKPSDVAHRWDLLFNSQAETAARYKRTVLYSIAGENKREADILERDYGEEFRSLADQILSALEETAQRNCGSDTRVGHLSIAIQDLFAYQVAAQYMNRRGTFFLDLDGSALVPDTYFLMAK